MLILFQRWKNRKICSCILYYIKGKLYVRNAGDYLAQMVNIAGGDYIFSDLNADKQAHRKWE